MERYSGQDLGESPHIVVLGSCKVGNFIVSIPVLNGLRTRFPDAAIGFIGSELTADFEQALACVDWRTSWDASIETAGQQLVGQLTNKWIVGACCSGAQPGWFQPSHNILGALAESAICCRWRVNTKSPSPAALGHVAAAGVSR